MKFTIITNLFERQAENRPSGPDNPDQLLFDNYEFLRKSCAKAVGLLPAALESGFRGRVEAEKELAAEELFNAVIDRLRQDAFRVLREFTSRASITTYLTTIVVNLARDRYRSEKGRNRSRERAEQHGEVGNLLHQLVIEKEFTPEAAHEWLTREKGIAISLSRIIDIITDLKGRRRLTIDPNAAAVVIDDDADETGEVHFTLRDERPLQDERLIGAHRELLRKQVLDEFIGGLSGEERLMFRMRFPADEEEEAKSFSEIARFTGLTEKAVDHRVRRLLAGFREKLLKRGIGLDDLLGSG